MHEWIFGRNPVYEALRTRRRDLFRLHVAKGVQTKGRLAEILQLAYSARIPVEYVNRSQIEKQETNSQGVALEVGAYPYVNLIDILERAESRGEAPFILILDTLQDPQNLGTLLRTAEVVGVHGVVLPLRRTATITSAVVSASSGASEHLMVAQANLAQAIAELKEADVWAIGLEGREDSEPISQVRLDGAISLVVGNEGEGMRQLVRDSCDVLMRLPMRGQIDSLNAATAGSVALYFAWQARQFSGFVP